MLFFRWSSCCSICFQTSRALVSKRNSCWHVMWVWILKKFYIFLLWHILLLGKEPKKLHLMSLLHSIKHMWCTIGERLAVCHGDIKSFEYNVKYDDTNKLSEVLQVWIDKRKCEVSWKRIITVIDDPPIENKRVSDEICEFLARSDIQNEYLSTGKSERHCVRVYLFLYHFRLLFSYIQCSTSNNTKNKDKQRYVKF